MTAEFRDALEVARQRARSLSRRTYDPVAGVQSLSELYAGAGDEVTREFAALCAYMAMEADTFYEAAWIKAQASLSLVRAVTELLAPLLDGTDRLVLWSPNAEGDRTTPAEVQHLLDLIQRARFARSELTETVNAALLRAAQDAAAALLALLQASTDVRPARVSRDVLDALLGLLEALEDSLAEFLALETKYQAARFTEVATRRVLEEVGDVLENDPEADPADLLGSVTTLQVALEALLERTETFGTLLIPEVTLTPDKANLLGDVLLVPLPESARERRVFVAEVAGDGQSRWIDTALIDDQQGPHVFEQEIRIHRDLQLLEIQASLGEPVAQRLQVETQGLAEFDGGVITEEPEFADAVEDFLSLGSPPDTFSAFDFTFLERPWLTAEPPHAGQSVSPFNSFLIWGPDESYVRGDIVWYDGNHYICKADHTSNAGLPPSASGEVGLHWWDDGATPDNGTQELDVVAEDLSWRYSRFWAQTMSQYAPFGDPDTGPGKTFRFFSKASVWYTSYTPEITTTYDSNTDTWNTSLLTVQRNFEYLEDLTQSWTEIMALRSDDVFEDDLSESGFPDTEVVTTFHLSSGDVDGSNFTYAPGPGAQEPFERRWVESPSLLDEFRARFYPEYEQLLSPVPVTWELRVSDGTLPVDIAPNIWARISGREEALTLALLMPPDLFVTTELLRREVDGVQRFFMETVDPLFGAGSTRFFFLPGTADFTPFLSVEYGGQVWPRDRIWVDGTLHEVVDVLGNKVRVEPPLPVRDPLNPGRVPGWAEWQPAKRYRGVEVGDEVISLPAFPGHAVPGRVYRNPDPEDVSKASARVTSLSDRIYLGTGLAEGKHGRCVFVPPAEDNTRLYAAVDPEGAPFDTQGAQRTARRKKADIDPESDLGDPTEFRDVAVVAKGSPQETQVTAYGDFRLAAPSRIWEDALPASVGVRESVLGYWGQLETVDFRLYQELVDDEIWEPQGLGGSLFADLETTKKAVIRAALDPSGESPPTTTVRMVSPLLREGRGPVARGGPPWYARYAWCVFNLVRRTPPNLQELREDLGRAASDRGDASIGTPVPARATRVDAVTVELVGALGTAEELRGRTLQIPGVRKVVPVRVSRVSSVDGATYTVALNQQLTEADWALGSTVEVLVAETSVTKAYSRCRGIQRDLAELERFLRAVENPDISVVSPAADRLRAGGFADAARVVEECRLDEWTEALEVSESGDVIELLDALVDQLYPRRPSPMDDP